MKILMLSLPDYGDLFTFEEFGKMLKSGIVTDDDGSGYLATATQYSEEYPVFEQYGEVRIAELRKIFTHVLWFNK